jgi:hypothetical protein
VDDFDSLREQIAAAIPAWMTERNGRMSGMAMRLILAYIDGQPETVAALVERIGTWDDDPGRHPYPLPRYEFPAQEAARTLGTMMRGIEQVQRVTVLNEEVADGAVRLIEAHGPEQHRKEALERLASVPAGTEPFSILGDSTEPGPLELIVAAAATAGMCTNPKYVAAPQAVRMTVVNQMREAEALAGGVPSRERITEISDRQALWLLTQLYDGDDNFSRTIPRQPSERGPWEWDILALLKTHLLETPAEATTPEQAAALKAQILATMQAAHATRKHTGPPPRGTKAGQRTQPHRKKPKGKR